MQYIVSWMECVVVDIVHRNGSQILCTEMAHRCRKVMINKRRSPPFSLHEVIRGMEVQFLLFFTFALNSVGVFASCPVRFTALQVSAVTRSPGGWVDPRYGLCCFGKSKRENTSCCQKNSQNLLGCPTLSLVTVPTELFNLLAPEFYI